MTEIRLRIDSSFDAARKISAAIRKACDKEGIAQGEAALIDLAAIEGTNNVIKHGYRGAAGGTVNFHMTIDAQSISIEISDTGLPVPPAVAEASDALPRFDPDDRESLPVSGMGIAIMRQVMDELSFFRRRGRNVLRMKRNREQIDG